MSAIGILLEEQGRHNEAEVKQREALRLRKEILGDEDPATLQSMVAFACTLYSLSRDEEAELIHRQALDLQNKGGGRLSRRDICQYVRNSTRSDTHAKMGRS